MPKAAARNAFTIYLVEDQAGGTLYMGKGNKWLKAATAAGTTTDDGVVTTASGGTGATTIAGAQKNLKTPVSLFDRYADTNNTSTTETTLYSDSIGAARLANNGDKILAQYGGTFSGAVSATQQLRLYFGPNGTNADTLVFDSGALSIGVASPSWDMCVTAVRESSGNVRLSVLITTSSAALSAASKYTKVTGLTLTAAQFLTLTGTAAGVGAGSNQITASMGYGQFAPAA
jgi:hypothetical protein